MSLTASMWTSVAGLLAHGEKMNVVGNNIANVNTIGFKGSRMDFQDFVHQTVNSAAGPAQIGRGVSIGAIYGDFSQGAFETSNEATDIAISGNGFYKVVPKNSDDAYYTRAGNFRFDAQGYLCDPHGYVLQGWAIEQPDLTLATNSSATASNTGSRIVGTGVPQDVRLASFSCDPRHTQNMTVAVNLDSNCGAEKAKSTSGSGGATPVPGDPFFALFQNWNTTPNASGQIDPPLGMDGFMYQQSMKVYDEGGTPHTITIYFDPVDENTLDPSDPNYDYNLAVADPTRQRWEFIVTMDPSEDVRKFQNDGSGVAGEYDVPVDKKGILMTGIMDFSTSGELKDIMAFVPTQGGAAFDNLNTWVAAPISGNGYPMFAANFSGQPNASEVWSTVPGEQPTVANPGSLNTNARGYITELDLGLKSNSNWWDFSGTPTPSLTAGGVKMNNVNIAGMGSAASRQQPTSTSYGSKTGNNFFERYANQDGYTYGELSSISVNQDGILTGRYSNGVTLELFQITLYDFNSLTNLRREGGNLFTQTRESGDPTQGAANTGSFGTVHSNSIEQSNVDLAREFVQMITTQRGFQANSKSVTTVDTMLETVINMKR
ncbi:MAG: flagellar hook-basal body complex protein [Deltaproteobacteria bacterium]|nr:flagellar hook-basal body complex protein [Deltaproteobacteria bacterium]